MEIRVGPRLQELPLDWRRHDMSQICANRNSRKLATQAPPAIPGPPDAATWLDRLVGPADRVYNIFVVKRADYQAAQDQYVPGSAWTFYYANKSVFLEEYLPRQLRPENSPTGAGGLIATAQVPDLCSNALQEAYFYHECTGHGCHGSRHEDADPAMHQSETMDHVVRLAGLAEWARHYPTTRIMPWTRGMNVFEHGEDATVPYTPMRPWLQPAA